MYMHLIITEKPSAGRNFGTALGGMSGTYDGKKYKVVNLFGHMTQFVEPHEMVSDHETENFKSWNPEFMPWDVTKLLWKKEPQKMKRQGKMTSKASAINDIKKQAQSASVLVIATDKDPSGEGQLIGWEVIQAIGWTGPVKRMYFLDESKVGLQKSFKDMVDLPAFDKDGEYLKADVRSRWDFVSMQLTRLATNAARAQGYNVVVRQGRLKSVITKLVADQLALRDAYVKKPYYEVKYEDEFDNKFRRKFNEEEDTFRFENKADAEADMKRYNESEVVEESKSRKQTSPGKLLDLGGLASILSSKGFKSKEILYTYQKMYEDEIVSYPRTEDKFISSEQFKEMLPLVDQIAGVVGADVSLLTHRAPRKTHVKEGGAHGANRPGKKVPTSLNSLSKYGASATAIYELLGKNFLAMFGENYIYDSVKGHIKDHPDFKTTVNIPVDLGFKAIFDSDAEAKDEDDRKEDTGKALGKTGKPFIDEGANRRPANPTHKWLERQLSRYDVGTGATRVNTLSEVTAGKSALLTDKRGTLGLTGIGEVASALLEGSQIGDPTVTEKLFKSMNEVGKLKLDPEVVLQTATDLVKHDKLVFFTNAQTMASKIKTPVNGIKVKPKAGGVFKPTGNIISFNKEWSQYEFSDDEVANLLNGDVIEIEPTSKAGKKYKVEGQLGEAEYKGKKFWGFQPDFKDASDYTIETAPMPKTWSGYTFTEADEKTLRAGEKLHIKATSARTKSDFEVDVTFEITEYKGNKGWRIKPHFEERKDPSEYTLKDAPFKTTWSGYTLSDAEIADVRAGNKIMITATSARTKKEFTCNLSLKLKTYKGKKFWGLDAEFN